LANGFARGSMTMLQPIDRFFGQCAINAQFPVEGEQFDKFFVVGSNRHARHVSAKAGFSVVPEHCTKLGT